MNKRREDEEDDYVLKDGESLRVPMTFMDCRHEGAPARTNIMGRRWLPQRRIMRLERVHGNVGDDGIERVTTQASSVRAGLSHHRKKERDMSRLAASKAAPHLYNFIDRVQTEMPDWFMPSAAGVLIAGEDMLHAVGHHPGACHTVGWSRRVSGFNKIATDGKSVLWVQQCGSYWIIERSRLLDDGRTRDETLVCAFGSVPIWLPRVRRRCEWLNIAIRYRVHQWRAAGSASATLSFE
jgi:hypothetical protein